MKRTVALAAVFVLLIACSSDPDETSGDAGSDGASSDATADARPDIGSDTVEDAVEDASDTSRDTAQAGSWSDIAPLGIGPRQETAVVELGGLVYVIGGYTDTGSLVNTVEAYDPNDDTWTEVAAVPEPLHHANAAVANSKIYVLGYLVQGFAPSGRCFVYDPAEDNWTELDPMPSGSERGSSAIATIDGDIYVAGGLQSGAVAVTSKFDPDSGEWTSLPDAPRSFDHAGYGAMDGKFVVAGGRDTRIGAFTDDVDIFDPEAGEWTSGAPMPTARGGVASAVHDGELYVFGGEGSPDVATGVFDDVEAYDPAADTWRVLTPMPNPRHGMGAASVDGRIIVPGGADEQAFAAVDTSSALTP